MLYPIVLRRVTSSVGFPWAVRIIGFIALATLAAAVVLSKPVSPRSPRQLLDMSAFRDVSYIAFVAAAFCEWHRAHAHASTLSQWLTARSSPVRRIRPEFPGEQL